MTKAIQNTISGVISYRERLFYVFSISICLLGLLYAGLVHSMVHNIVAREALVKQNRVYAGSIGELEAQYFSLKNSVNIATAHSMGFSEPVTLSYISSNGGVARAGNDIQ